MDRGPRISLAGRLGRAAHIKYDRVASAGADIEGRAISYQNLIDENSILKCDLRNLNVNVRKLQLDHELQRQSFDLQRGKVEELGSRYLKENVKWISASLTPNNFVTCKQRLQDVIQRMPCHRLRSAGE